MNRCKNKTCYCCCTTCSEWSLISHQLECLESRIGGCNTESFALINRALHALKYKHGNLCNTIAVYLKALSLSDKRECIKEQALELMLRIPSSVNIFPGSAHWNSVIKCNEFALTCGECNYTPFWESNVRVLKRLANKSCCHECNHRSNNYQYCDRCGELIQNEENIAELEMEIKRLKNRIRETRKIISWTSYVRTVDIHRLESTIEELSKKENELKKLKREDTK